MMGYASDRLVPGVDLTHRIAARSDPLAGLSWQRIRSVLRQVTQVGPPPQEQCRVMTLHYWYSFWALAVGCVGIALRHACALQVARGVSVAMICPPHSLHPSLAVSVTSFLFLSPPPLYLPLCSSLSLSLSLPLLLPTLFPPFLSLCPALALCICREGFVRACVCVYVSECVWCGNVFVCGVGLCGLFCLYDPVVLFVCARSCM